MACFQKGYRLRCSIHVGRVLPLRALGQQSAYSCGSQAERSARQRASMWGQHTLLLLGCLRQRMPRQKPWTSEQPNLRRLIPLTQAATSSGPHGRKAGTARSQPTKPNSSTLITHEVALHYHCQRNTFGHMGDTAISCAPASLKGRIEPPQSRPSSHSSSMRFLAAPPAR